MEDDDTVFGAPDGKRRVKQQNHHHEEVQKAKRTQNRGGRKMNKVHDVNGSGGVSFE